jgi:hypothetical protein
MTDDDLDRALFALPLAEPPSDLRARILAATVLAQPPAFRMWELWLLGTLLGLAAWLCVDALQTGPHAVAAVTPSTLFWFAVGLSSVWWISNLTLMPRPSVPVTKRT